MSCSLLASKIFALKLCILLHGLYSAAPCDVGHFSFGYQAQEQIKQIVSRYVNIPRTIVDEKSMHFQDRDHKHSRVSFVDLVILMLNARRKGNLIHLNSGHISWYHRNPRNANFLTFKFPYEYGRVNNIHHQFSYHQSRKYRT